jgi:hypothetical protein
LEPEWAWWIMGCSHHTFYKVVGWQKVCSQGEGGNGGETSMTSVIGDENEEGKAMRCGRYRRGSGGGGEADDIMKSGMVAGEAEGAAGIWRSNMIK